MPHIYWVLSNVLRVATDGLSPSAPCRKRSPGPFLGAMRSSDIGQVRYRLTGLRGCVWNVPGMITSHV